MRFQKITQLVLIAALFTITYYQPVFSQKGIYSNTEFQFSVCFPKGWMVKDGQIGQYHTVSSSNNSGESMNVVIQKLGPEFQTMNLGTYSTKQHNTFIRGVFEGTKVKYPDAVLINSGSMQLGNKPAVFLVTKHSAKTNSGIVQVQGIQIITFDRGKQFILGGTSSPEKYNKFEKEFKKVLNTFSFK